MISVTKAQEKEIFFSVNIASCNLKTPPKNIRFTNGVFTDQAILKLPASYTESGKPTRLVYMAHGAGGGVTDKEWFLNRYELQKTLLEAGFAVFDTNGGSVENMGGELAVTSAYLAYQHIVKHFNVHPQILVTGFSMGGLTSTNFVYRHSSLVLAHAMYCPVLDLYEQAWKNPWLKSTRKALADVYHFKDVEGAEYDRCATDEYNPLESHSFQTLSGEIKMYPVPVKIWHAVRDRVVTIESSRAFYQRIRNAGLHAELIEIDSDDHGLSCGNEIMNSQLLEFLKQYQ